MYYYCTRYLCNLYNAYYLLRELHIFLYYKLHVTKNPNLLIFIYNITMCIIDYIMFNLKLVPIHKKKNIYIINYDLLIKWNNTLERLEP